ncbi:DNA circularization N-terminal domain-containing protein [uncultured Martelella sp.]|uniref:DNA circularization N-terminal domain-containing protein n=1 Tax=uncultured Martelella sp. TaxID=392331 RepID=UPI0029C9605B|nr:DNA circularization N-terminal domain-containing protein [uncultured Martelella sp.]
MRNWAATLFPGSYKGVPFYVEYDSASGGKRLAVHEHAGGYQSTVEELGKATEAFDVTAYTIGDFSDVQALALKAVLNAPGPGLLTMPIDPPMLATAERYWRTRSKRELGYVGFGITFVPHPTALGKALNLGNVNAAVAAGVGLAAAGMSSFFG